MVERGREEVLCFLWQGAGVIGTSRGNLTFNTANMQVGSSYVFVVVVRKGGRSAKGQVVLTIADGQPPEVTIR